MTAPGTLSQPSLLRFGSPSVRRSGAFTLVELLVVVAIVIVILGLIVPAASTLWAERKSADAVNAVQGLLMTARARSLQAGGVETGFFAFLDADGVQRIVTIAQPKECIADPSLRDVFVITNDRDQVLPPPMRLVPRYVIDEKTVGSVVRLEYEVFDDDELASDDFGAVTKNQAQRHRNFFTMVFSAGGEVLVNRDVLIRDVDEDEDGLGDRTGLRVGPGDPNIMSDPVAAFSVRCRADADPRATTAKYYLRVDTPETQAALPAPVGFLIVDDKDVALNFPTVDGPMVYDQSLFADAERADKRRILLETAQPLYVSRFTGVVVRGPVGEVASP